MFLRLEAFGRYLELGRIKTGGDDNDTLDLVTDHPRPIEQYVGFQPPLVTLAWPEDLHPEATVPTGQVRVLRLHQTGVRA